jgi:hypothetical protein
LANLPLLATPVTIKAAGAETVSTIGAAVSVQTSPSTSAGFWLATVAITAASGTPTLLVVIEGSSNTWQGGGAWFELATIGVDSARGWGMGALPAPFTAPITVSAPVAAGAGLLRYRSIVGGGTPSVTYSVVVQYFTNPDHA